MRTAVVALVIALTTAACGASGGGSSGPLSQPSPAGSISGILLEHTSAAPADRRPAAGVTIGLYTRPISQGGPVQADPPRPVATVKTGADGRFVFRHPGSRPRYFVAVVSPGPYTGGRWARPGGRSVTLIGCTDCPMPL